MKFSLRAITSPRSLSEDPRWVTSSLLPEVADFLLWYAKDKIAFEPRYRQLYEDRVEETAGTGAYRHVPNCSVGRGGP